MVRNKIDDFLGKLHEILDNLNNNVNSVFSDEIARRAFANNAFDGALTLLGILMGSLALPEFHPSTVIKIGVSACLAMGMSGTFGRFISERAERRKYLRQMEKELFTDLKGTRLEREAGRKIILISVVDGISPALAAVIPLLPFFLAQASIIPVNLSIIASFILVFLVLFALGMFLGKTSEENAFLFGGLVVSIGLVTSLIIFLISIYFS